MSETLLTLTALAFGGGIAAFFAPCAVPLLPGYVGYYVGGADTETPLGGSLLRGTAAGLGVVAVFGVLAAVVVTAGQSVVNQLRFLEPVVGIALVILGIAMIAGRTPTVHVDLPARRRSVLGFAVFGAGYAVAATGCLAGVFGALVLEAATVSLVGVAVVILGYAVGLGGTLLGATVVIAVGHDVGAATLPAYVEWIRPVAGVLVVLAGLLQLYQSAVLLL